MPHARGSAIHHAITCLLYCKRPIRELLEPGTKLGCIENPDALGSQIRIPPRSEGIQLEDHSEKRDFFIAPKETCVSDHAG